MDERFQAILDSLPPRPLRSRLEPYTELIHELRRRGRSYREIAAILADRCGVRVAVHTVYNFVRVRTPALKKATKAAKTAAGSSGATESCRPDAGGSPGRAGRRGVATDSGVEATARIGTCANRGGESLPLR